MANNFPPGVTGNEYAIAGPDYEKESDVPCSQCDNVPSMVEQGFQGNRWLVCDNGHTTELEPPDPGDDPDRRYDEERDREMLGIDRPDELDNEREEQ